MRYTEWNPTVAAVAGAHLLDMARPGWRDRIDLSRLDMGAIIDRGTGGACVAAQLDRAQLVADAPADVAVVSGSWSAYLDGILAEGQVKFASDGNRHQWLTMHGFEAPDDDGQGGDADLAEMLRRYERLTRAWRKVLTA